MNNKILEGKVAVVTGAAMGMGEAIAKLFAQEGAVVVGIDIKEQEGEQTVKEIKKQGGNAYFIRGDVREWKAGGDCERVVKAVLDDLGRIDILVNNAGRQTGKGFLELSPEEVEDITRLNYLGPFRLMQLVAWSMIKRGVRGNIINITSVHSEIIRGFPEYSATKAALKMITREAAYELGPYGIRVNCIAPGATESEGMGGVLRSDPGIRRQVIEKTPLGRIGKTTDIAQATLFLASDNSSFITGAEIVVDGGISQRNESVEDIKFPTQEK